MRRYLYSLLALALVGCQTPVNPEEPTKDDDPVDVVAESIKFDVDGTTLEVGSTYQINATVLPENAVDKSLAFSSSKAAVATVDDAGLVTAVKVGEADIFVICGPIMESFHVKVVAQPVYVTEVTLDKTELVLDKGKEKQLVAEWSPRKNDEDPQWVSSDESVATVSSDGLVTAIDRGVATISVKFKNCEASCQVTVHGSIYLMQVDASELSYSGSKDKEVQEALCVARGEVADIQVIAYANDPVANLKAELLYFCKEGQSSGIVLQPRMYWERSVYCTRYWNEWQGGAPGGEIRPTDRMFPDALMPMDKWDVNLNAGGKNGLWMDFYIPRNFESGKYVGEVKVSGLYGGKEVFDTKKFEVEVFPATLPEDQSLIVLNWLQGDGSAMNNGESYEWKMERILIPFMNDYGQNAWRLTEYNIHVSNPKVENGKMVFDFSALKENIEKCIELCPDIKIMQAKGICDDSFGFTAWKIVDGKVAGFYGKYDDPEALESISTYAKALGEFLSKHTLPNGKTWLEGFVQTIHDEPWDEHADAYNAVARAFKKGCPDLKIFDATCTAKLDPEAYDCICPQLDDIWKSGYQAQGTQVQWMYTCLRPQGNLANRLFGMPLVWTRYLHWENYHWNAVGYLHWGLQYWNGVADANGNIDAYGDAYGSVKMHDSPGGDNYIIYPGNLEAYPSLRLCNMRDGINDYELLKMIEAKDPSAAQDFLHRIVYETPLNNPGPDNARADCYSSRYEFYDSNVRHLREVRREMLEYLSR